MSYTRKEWWIGVLGLIGNTSPTQFIIDYGVAWTQFETGGPPGASYNLLNTTEPNTPGVVSDFNSVGVKNYDSFEHGIEANAKVLGNGLYPSLFLALKNNLESLLKGPTQEIMHELGLWGTGHAADIANLAGRPDSLLSDQPFSGEGPTGPPVTLPPGPPPPILAPSKIVKIGHNEDFKLELVGDRYTVVAKHSSEAGLKAKGYI